MSACIPSISIGDPVAKTSTGKVRGQIKGGAFAFLGIPYAKAARFQQPAAADPWAGVRDCTKFGPSAPQTNPAPSSGPPPIILAHLPRLKGARPPQRPPESEDCQVLNIWTGDASQQAKRPVMVWLHGGFFSSSSGSTVDGTVLAARHGVIAVSLNHRLNAFGFSDLSNFGEDFADSANVGMLDIIAALKWIKENISEFGGDPYRVMVLGTSGGGMKTSILMASPKAEGLLHRAGVHSGPGLTFLTREEAAEASEKLLQEAGLSRANASDLSRIPVDQLLGAYHRVSAQMRPNRFSHIPCFGPVVDSNFLTEQPFSPGASAQTSNIPMIIGSNTDEMTFFMGNDQQGFDLDEAGFDARVSGLLGERADEIAAHYRALMHAASPSRRWIRLFSDYSIVLPIYRQAQRHAAISDSKTWLYQLALTSQIMDGKLGSTHTIETPLIFDSPEASPLLAGQKHAKDVARLMSTAWSSFAADGVPALSAWKDFSKSGGAMCFDGASEFTDYPESETLEMLGGIFPV